MDINQINCIIFENCNSIFPELIEDFKSERKFNEVLEVVAKSNNESNLKLIKKCGTTQKKFYIHLYLEFLLKNKLCKHPYFLICMDYAEKTANVLRFESGLSPNIRLDVETDVNGQKYINKVAQKDITLLCYNLMKQLIELGYKTNV